MLGTHLHVRLPNAYRLVASVPMDAGRTLLFYQIEFQAHAGSDRVLFPVVIDAHGLVAAANDSLSFAPPPRRPPERSC